MTMKLGVVMDPIASIHVKKDSTLAMLLEAKARGWTIFYFETANLMLQNGKVYGTATILDVFDNEKKWFSFNERIMLPLSDLDIILLRKDPPFDLDYLYTTQILEYAQREGVLVANNPQALRDANEKLFACQFPQCCPPTLVSKKISELKEFLQAHREIICKPLHGMGGQSIFYLSATDMNASVVFELMTQHEQQFMMLQRYIPEVKAGDKRILLINGEPVPYALARIPMQGELRGNLAAGATGVAQPLSDRDRWICEEVGPILREKGLYFVGIDVIGDYLTEINVTSPTCIRELDTQCDLNIASQLLDVLEGSL